MLSLACCLADLDGCYHCGFAHPSLSAALDMDGYHTEAHERVSFQLADPVDASSVKEGDQLWQDVISSRIEGAPCPQRAAAAL